ncbi:MAG: hypothetical protein OQK22_16140, partial [Colwellia sp.]|nr:hypothetical protein [Colwellia sp.]
QVEITDPDDIDALLESMGTEQPVVEPEAQPEIKDEQVEITDPDDIDALLESMGTGENETSEQVASSNDLEALLEPAAVEDGEQSQDDEAIDESSINKAKIENLTEEYVAPLLATDFSDIINNASDSSSIVIEEDDVADEEIDIDALISKDKPVEPQQPHTEEPVGIGDDLADEQLGAFDEETLSELLSDKAAEQTVELTPDFTDQNVLADLLNDSDENDSNAISEASEINDIQELDNLEFDELLANIEEESSVANQVADFNQDDDLDSPISLDDFDDPNSHLGAVNEQESNNDAQNFVSVDSLLSASQDEQVIDEPYNEDNIDVGLDEYSEFTKDVNPIDVDIDENGMAAKLDLAKVYLEIGDADNAHVILQEIIKQGNNQQKLEAQGLLDNL